MTYPLVALGNPLLDIQVNVDKAYLDKYDLKENDAILVEDKHMPIFAEASAKPGVKFIAGGAAQNAARGAQYVLPPNSVVYFGSVGKDEYSEQLLKANEVAGVKSAYLVHDDIPTGKCAALINGENHRSLVTDLAAANHYKLEHLKAPENWALVEGAKYYYVGGFHLTVCPPAINAIGEHASQHTDKTFVINLSAPFLCQFFQEPMDSSSPYWDVLIGNESEAAAWAEAHGLADKKDDVKAIAAAIAVLPKANAEKPRVVIITQGTDPTVVAKASKATTGFGADADASKVDITEFPVRKIAASEIVDTNGAGDAFAGGFLGALVEGKSIEEAVDVGQWLASVSLKEVGPSFPYSPKVSYTKA
ncbi:uncharacterized protein SAPINGB_P002301 [Magnusiomyces paraingens]|uniref:Adenosine kinase n=1 Tax=Magnusiomyces paraingens TaxID=2606893 RepID=A0A5E8BD24_9ASCO|nr:uncharacterized protein SAPINGB_P002301 [Saprochaete ingens]VVT49502.1 unnamed protein product [Saprochaete ingens]